MFVSNKLTRLVAVLSLGLLLIPPPLLARNKKGDKLISQGRAAEQRRDYDQALAFFEQAVQQDPADAGYLLAVRRVRFFAGQYHVDLGQKLRAQGELEKALAEFQKAYSVDPGSSIAEQELRRTYLMVEREKQKAAGQPNGAASTPEERGLTPVQQARKESDERFSRALSAPELKPISRQFTNLKMTNQPPRILYETVSKLAGINVVFDSEYQDQGKRYSVDLTNTTLDDALEYLSVLTKSYIKPLNTNTLFVTNDNVTKRRDYEDLVVKVFYLTNINTPTEMQEIVTAIRTITEIRRVFTYNAQNAIVVRGTVDQVLLTEKLINDMDKPKSEVVIDIIVMEVAQDYTRTLGLGPTFGGASGLDVSILSSPRNPILSGTTPTTTTTTDTTTGNVAGSTVTTTPSTGTSTNSGLISLAQVGRISSNDFSINLPGAILKAVLSDSRNRVLQSPQVRAADGQKASLHIGDRIPYAGGTYGATSLGVGGVGGAGGVGGGAGYSPFGFGTQFQYADVGVKVDLTPKIHDADEVSMQITVDISAVRGRIDIAGISQPIIGQRKIEHNIRIKEGEVSVLAGLTNLQDSNVVSGIPGVTRVPLLRRLFSSETVEKANTELLVALVPHIVRSPDYTEANLRSVVAGNDQIVKLGFSPRVEQPAPAPGAAKPGLPAVLPGSPVAPLVSPNPIEGPKPDQTAAPTPPATPVPNPATPPAAPNTAPLAAPATPVPGVPQPQAQARPDAADAPGGTARLVLDPPTANAKVGTAITVTAQIENVTDLFQSPMKLAFDPKMLRVNAVSVGNLLGGDGQKVTFSPTINNERGEVTVTLNRQPGSTGISGSGVLLSLTLQPLAPGITAFTTTELGLRTSRMQSIAVNPSVVMLNVQP